MHFSKFWGHNLILRRKSGLCTLNCGEYGAIMKKILFALLFLPLFFYPSLVGAADYIVGSGDVLQILVWKSPELSAEVLVRPDGKITLPAVGDIGANGLTTTQLRVKLEKVIAKFVKNPIVTLTVTTITNNKVYISGGGVATGVVAMSGNTTLFRLLCQLDNVKEADLDNAYLYRDGTKLVSNFYALFMEGDLSKDVELQANDIVHIPSNETNKIYVVGAVGAPKYIFYRHGMKVLDVILEAGGFGEYAKQSNIVIIRKDGQKLDVNIKDLLKGNDLTQNIEVFPGDYVIVRESMF